MELGELEPPDLLGAMKALIAAQKARTRLPETLPRSSDDAD